MQSVGFFLLFSFVLLAVSAFCLGVCWSLVKVPTLLAGDMLLLVLVVAVLCGSLVILNRLDWDGMG